ncbi:MAG TPA: aldo/keto reductase [Pyrinomonadaceae bacterium]|nr:aldo/keto reductase [Pyrinomonadaceae bacterium]
METKRLGKSDLFITPVGFGSWAVGGGGWQFAWGEQDDSQSIAAIHRALDLGMNWIDTAAVYGLGHSEEIVSKAVAGLSKQPYIFTKCSLVWDSNGTITHSLKRDSIRKEVEGSLKRLRVETIDLYQIHWPDPDAEIEEGWTTLAELKREGKVRYIGVSNFDVAQMKRAQAIAPIDSLQPPYSLIHPEVEDEILPFCEANNIGVIVYSPMMSGLLSGRMTRERIANFPDDDWRSKSPDFQEPRLSRNLQLAELLRNIGSRHGRSAGEVAIAWTLRLSAVTGAIVGGRGPEQVEGIIGAGTFRLSEAELAEIDAFAQANTAQAAL